MVRKNTKRTSSGIHIYLLDRDIVIKCLEQGGGREKEGEGEGEWGERRLSQKAIMRRGTSTLFGAHQKQYPSLRCTSMGEEKVRGTMSAPLE